MLAPMDDLRGAYASGVRARLRALGLHGWIRLGLGTLGFLAVLVAVGIVLSPLFVDLKTLGGHDWDEMQAQRYLAIKSLLKFHQFPFWNPYACGGFDAWGNIQGDTNVVSPWFLAYLVLPLNLALRVEVVGIVLISALGTWLWAGRFTRSAALRAFVCVVFVVNGRWALQAATGHAWHLYYAWMPLTLYFHDSAMGATPSAPIRYRGVVYCGICIALMVYSGAIYPLPHTALLLGLYALVLAISWRTPKPLLIGILAGAIGFGLSAPKLLPVLENVARFPRLVESPEAIDLHAFVQMLIAPHQDVGSRPAQIPMWGWHEYGMYIGGTATVTVLGAMLFVRGARERALLIASVAALLLGFGAFDEWSPWTILHAHLPIFKSQHVPSRWLYPWILLGATLAASVGERFLAAVARRRQTFRLGAEILLLVPVCCIGYDIAISANLPMQHSFWMELPTVRESIANYHQEARVPQELKYRVSDYGPPALPATMANVGVIECTLHAGLNVWARDSAGHAVGAGARGRGDADYKGEAYLASGAGKAQVVSFTPNAVIVEVEGAAPGDVLVLNQNWDPGWKVNGDTVLNHEDAVATTVQAGHENGRFEFRFRSHRFVVSSLIGLVTIALIAGVGRYRRRPARPQPG